MKGWTQISKGQFVEQGGLSAPGWVFRVLSFGKRGVLLTKIAGEFVLQTNMSGDMYFFPKIFFCFSACVAGEAQEMNKELVLPEGWNPC